MMEEQLLRWRLNGERQGEILCSPGGEEDLLRGRLITDRRAACAAEIRPAEGEWLARAEGASPLRSLTERLETMPRCASGRRESASALKEMMERLMAVSNSDGRHTVTLTCGDARAVGRDIGRHNALDRAVGGLIALGLCPGDAVLCTSGRISVEILAKAAAAGIPILCTCKQAGTLAQAWAERLDIALVQVRPAFGVCGAAWRVLP